MVVTKKRSGMYQDIGFFHYKILRSTIIREDGGVLQGGRPFEFMITANHSQVMSSL